MAEGKIVFVPCAEIGYTDLVEIKVKGIPLHDEDHLSSLELFGIQGKSCH